MKKNGERHDAYKVKGCLFRSVLRNVAYALNLTIWIVFMSVAVPAVFFIPRRYGLNAEALLMLPAIAAGAAVTAVLTRFVKRLPDMAAAAFSAITKKAGTGRSCFDKSVCGLGSAKPDVS